MRDRRADTQGFGVRRGERGFERGGGEKEEEETGEEREGEVGKEKGTHQEGGGASETLKEDGPHTPQICSVVILLSQ